MLGFQGKSEHTASCLNQAMACWRWENNFWTIPLSFFGSVLSASRKQTPHVVAMSSLIFNRRIAPREDKRINVNKVSPETPSYNGGSFSPSFFLLEMNAPITMAKAGERTLAFWTPAVGIIKALQQKPQARPWWKRVHIGSGEVRRGQARFVGDCSQSLDLRCPVVASPVMCGEAQAQGDNIHPLSPSLPCRVSGMHPLFPLQKEMLTNLTSSSSTWS